MRLFKKILLSVLFTVGFFAAVETALFFVGVGESWSPFEQERDSEGSWVAKLAPRGAFHFHSERFPVDKPSDTFRVFTFGGSSTYGYPFSRAHSRSSFSGMLRVLLTERYPQRRIEVINCGSPGMDSRASLEILHAALDYSPDALVVYSGHNEFLPQNVTLTRRALEQPLWNGVLEFAGSLRLFGLLRSAITPKLPQREEVTFNDLVQYDQMIGPPLCGPDETKAVLTGYRQNLTAMAEAATVPLFFCLPASNLADMEPNVSTHSTDLDPRLMIRFDEAFSEGRAKAAQEDWSSAIEAFKKANRADPNVAESHYQLGRALEAAGEFSRARAEYLRARDLDGRPLRATAAILEIVETVAREQSRVTRIDTMSGLTAAAPNGLIGNGQIIDNVHPTLEGDYVLARQIADALGAAGLPAGARSERPDPDFAECLRKTGSRPELVTEGLAEAGLYLLRFVPMRYDRARRAARTEEVFQQVLAEKPDNFRALHGLATLYLMVGRTDEAKTILDSTLEKQPASAALLVHFAKLSPYLTRLYQEAGLDLEALKAKIPKTQ